MKRGIFVLFILLLALPIVFAETPNEAKITSYVNDYGNIFTPEEEAILSNALNDIYNSKTSEFAVVTIKSLNGYDAQGFAQEISDGKLGHGNTNNGLLLLIAVEEQKYWFNVGRGLEPIFNDAKIGRIGRNQIVPYFKNGQYFEGTLSSINEIAIELKVNLTNKVTPLTPEETIGINPVWIYFGIIIIMSIFRTIAAGKQKGKKRKGNDSLFWAAIFASSMLRGGRGGLGGGGFGGFGGGGFGGGGAGGGW